MALPSHEDISINKTKWFVTRQDIEAFNSWTKSLNDTVIPFEKKSKECEIKNIIGEGHAIESSIELLNDEIIRMLRWTKKEMVTDTEKLAKNFKDVKDRYIKARDTLEYDCKCEHNI